MNQVEQAEKEKQDSIKVENFKPKFWRTAVKLEEGLKISHGEHKDFRVQLHHETKVRRC